MCGIFFILNKSGTFSEENIDLILSKFKLLSNRGPDTYSVTHISNYILGFHRLAINDTSQNGMQPFHLSNGKSN